LESKWIPEFSKNNFRGQNSLEWKVPYTIRLILERIYLKWACTSHLNTLNTSYGQKKGWESKCQFDSQPLKVGNCPDLLVCKWYATYHQKALEEGYNFASNITSIRGLQKKSYGPPKSRESQFFEFWDSQLVSPGTKWHLGASPMARHREYYKGEGDGFPQIWAVLSFLNLCMPVVCLCTKNAPTTH